MLIVDDDVDGDDGDDDHRSLVICIFVVSILGDIQKEPLQRKFYFRGIKVFGWRSTR